LAIQDLQVYYTCSSSRAAAPAAAEVTYRGGRDSVCTSNGGRQWHAAACGGYHLATTNEIPPFSGPTGDSYALLFLFERLGLVSIQ